MAIAVELSAEGAFFHPLPDGGVDVAYDPVEALVYTDGARFPTQLLTLEGDGQSVTVVTDPGWAPGTFETMNLSGRTQPGADVYVLGADAAATADASGAFTIYPTVRKADAELTFLVRQEGHVGQRATVDVSTAPEHSAFDVGELALQGAPTPATELPMAAPAAAEAPGAIVSIPATPAAAPVVRPVVPWYVGFWPLWLFLGASFGLVVAGTGALVFRSQLAAAWFRLRLRAGRFDRELSAHFTRLDAEYDALVELLGQLRGRERAVQELLIELDRIPGGMEGELRARYSGELSEIARLRREAEGWKNESEQRLKTLRFALLHGDSRWQPERPAPDLEAQIRQRREALRRSEEDLRRLEAAHREVRALRR